MTSDLNLIVCLALNGAIGFGNRLLYRLPSDLRRFKELTWGHTVLMGRLTYQSLPKGALPHRRNIVLTRSGVTFPGCDVYPTLALALAHTAPREKVFVIGGASVYRDALSLVSRLFLTVVDDRPLRADTFFPRFDPSDWRELKREHHPADARDERPYDFVVLERK